MNAPAPTSDTAPKTLWTHLKQGFIEAHRRRPISFYLLLTIPIVLLLGVRLMDIRQNPRMFVVTLSLMLIYFFLVCFKAVRDFFSILRNHLAAQRSTYKETVGDPRFVEELSKRAKAAREVGDSCLPEGK